jgi:dephospho-CoA kinase
MIRIGLTGGIACGKSTVAAMLREMGCHVIEADLVAHELIEPGRPAYEEIVREFGREILEASGRVDRASLGRIVFADAAKREKLNAIVHPRVREEVERRIAALERSDPEGIVVVVAALLFEAGYTEALDRMVVAWCRPEQQIERLRERGLPLEEAQRRIAAQWPVEAKRQRADAEIDCSRTLDETRRQVEELFRNLRERQAAARSRKDSRKPLH